MPDILEHIPKYMKIKEILRQEIEEGLLKDGQKMEPESVLTKRFGVSKMTIIHALQELVDEGYMLREQGRGTFVTYSGRRRPLIAVVAPQIDLRPLSFLMHGIVSAADRLQYEIVGFRINEDKESIKSLMNRLVSLKAAGMIVNPVGGAVTLEHRRIWRETLKNLDVPIVVLDFKTQDPIKASQIQTNNEYAMAELTRSVIKHGHRRLLLIRTDKREYLNMTARINGFLQAVYQYSDFVDCFHIISYDENDPMDRKRHVVQSFMDEFRPTALMALNDHIAADLMSILKTLPGDLHTKVSITGFDDLPFADLIGLTTVRQPLHEEGEKAMEMLHSMIKKGKRPYTTTLPCTVIVRDSLKTFSDENNRFTNASIR